MALLPWSIVMQTDIAAFLGAAVSEALREARASISSTATKNRTSSSALWPLYRGSHRRWVDTRARRSLTRSRRSSAQQRTSPAPVTLGSQELHPLYLVILCHALRGPGKGCGVIAELTLVNHVAHRVEKPVKSHPSKARDCLTLCYRDRAWSTCWRCHERARDRANRRPASATGPDRARRWRVLEPDQSTAIAGEPDGDCSYWFAMARRGLYAFDGVITTGRTTGLRD